jgi:hypothetical protein
MTTLDAALEKGTYVVSLSFENEDGAALTPAALTWSLFDENGSIVNSRLHVSIAVPAASVNVVLSGNDLVYSDSQSKRIMVVEGTYTSSYGTGLPLKSDPIEIPIQDLMGV